MKRSPFVFAVLLLVAVLSTTAQRRSVPSTQPSKEEVLYREAYKQVMDFWDSRIINCNGDYYFAAKSLEVNQTFLFECKRRTKFQVEGTTFYPRQLSEAEQLNGVDPLPVEWAGRVQIEFEVCRQSERGNSRIPGWGSWYDKKSIEGQGIQKVKGVWNLSNNLHIGNDHDRPLTLACSEVQSYLSDLPSNEASDNRPPSKQVHMEDQIGKVIVMGFYQSDGGSDVTKDIQGRRFAQSQVKYIRWSLYVKAEHPVAHSFKSDLRAVWLKVNDDGSLKQYWEQLGGTAFPFLGDGVEYSNGKGYDKPGKWERGRWKIRIFQGDVFVVEDGFEIY